MEVFAATVSISCTQKVTLGKDEQDFSIAITVNHSEDYAGAEFGLVCSDGVTVKSVSYSKSSSKAGPTMVGNTAWFSYFSGSNEYRGSMTATVSLQYTGTQNSSLVLKTVSIYTKSGTAVQTDKRTPNNIINIAKNGADNEVTTPTPAPTTKIPGTTKPPVATNKPGDTNTITTAKKTDKNGAVINEPEETNPNETTVPDSGGVTKITDENGNVQETTIPETKSVMGNSDDHNTDNGTQGNLALIVFLLISLCANAVLGYYVLHIKLSKRRSRMND